MTDLLNSPMRRWLKVMLLTAVMTSGVQAQTAGTIVGTLRDPQGASIPGATVAAVQIRTGASRSMSTDGSGDFVFALLPVGEYSVTVKSAGFQGQSSKVILQVDQTARVDFNLTLGAVATVEQVEAVAPILKTDTSDIGTVVDNQRMVELPMNGRNFIALNALDSGAAVQTGSRSNYLTTLFGGNYSFNGSLGDSSNYSIDGVIAKGMGDARVTLQLSIDAIQEFNQQQSLYSAEYSGGGGNVNVITRSGTNDLHGSVWEFFRNSALDARNFFDPKDVSPFRLNQFGGTLGGRIRRDRTFFFVNYEGLRQTKSVGQVFTVPTLAARQGNFSGQATVYDPSTTQVLPNGQITRTPFSGNVIPANRISPASAASFNLLYPLPNQPGTTRNLTGALTNGVTDDQGTGRLDHHFNDRNTLTARFSGEVPRRLNTAYASLPNFADNWNNTSYSTVLSHTHVITNQLINQARVGFNYIFQDLTSIYSDQNLVQQIGITGTQANRYPGPPAISTTGIGTTGSLSNTPNNRGENTFQLSDNVSYVRGSHSMGFGADIRALRENGGTAGSSRGSFSFTSLYSALPSLAGSGSAMADFVLGYPTNASVSIGNGFTNVRQTLSGVYFKDDWKISKDLTLNLGLRYEYFTPLREIRNRIPLFDNATGNLVTAGQNGVSDYLYNPDRNNFAPRFGLAWRPFGGEKTVIRAGFGLFYTSPMPYMGWSAGQSAPNLYSARVNNTTPFPTTTLVNAFPSSLLTVASTITVIDQSLVSPYNVERTFGIQQQLAKNTVLDVSYIGNKGNHLISGARNINQAVPGTTALQSRRRYANYTSISDYLSDGFSNYDALRVNLQRKLSRGLTFSGSYSWSKMLDTSDTPFLAATSNNARRNLNNPGAERGRAAFDARHRLVLNGVWQLPLGQGRLRTGWQVSGIASFQTGTPVDVNMSSDNSNTGDAGSFDRPNCVGDPNANAPHNVLNWFNKSAFATPTPLTFGTCGKNLITAPGTSTVDFMLSKVFAPVESLRIQFRAEGYNIFNHPNFNPPNASFGNPLFGQISSAGDARETQFAIKVIF